MTTGRRNAIRYISDGTYSVDEVRGVLADNGELVGRGPGETRFVPDDSRFPTTIFRADGIVELLAQSPDETSLEEYVQQLSDWLGVPLQRLKG